MASSLPAEVVQAILNVENGLGGMINSNDSVEFINNLVQTLAAVADLVGNPMGVLATNGLALQVTLAKMRQDAESGQPISPSDVLSAVGNVVAMAAAGAVALSPTGKAVPIFKAVALSLGTVQIIVPFGIGNAAATGASGAKSIPEPRRDPLTLDLDGDGLETTGTGLLNPIYFDHNGDGIKTSTGWVKSDDAFLVWDRNNDGIIDSGRELFGDSTIKSNGQTAIDGFDALADLDRLDNGGNNDGVVNASDVHFNNLRIWRDLNQDGVSQSDELFTLDSQHIIGLNVDSTEHSQILQNGNQIADKGTFIKSDGSQGTLGVITGNMADINLAEDTFHRTFPDVLDTSGIEHLPDMQGSGKVRDLREAATLSVNLQNLLTQFSSATTRSQQVALLEQLIDAWADTGGMTETLAQRVAAMPGYLRSDGVTIPYVIASSNLSAEWEQKLHVIETFTGSYFFGLPGTVQTVGPAWGFTLTGRSLNSSSVEIHVNLGQQQFDLLQQSYDAITSSVYNALVYQTRLKPLIDQITYTVNENGVDFDFSQVYASIESRISQDAVLGLTDLIDLNHATRQILKDTNWLGYSILESKIRTQPITPELTAFYSALNIKVDLGSGINGSSKNDTIVSGPSSSWIDGFAGDDVIFAGAGNDSLVGGSGDDNLYGQDGNDFLAGGAGNDVLVGGAGNDYLFGDTGSDIYIFNLGDGQDTISNLNPLGNGTADVDQILFGQGIGPQDVILKRNSANGLVIQIVNTSDQIIVLDYFNEASGPSYTVQIQFSDGTVLKEADIYEKVTTTTELDDYFVGTHLTDTLSGGAGNDFINAGNGDDLVNGDGGNDVLLGGFGNDVIFGGVGQDSLDGGDGNDLLDGGSENDTLYGSSGNDELNGGSENDNLFGGTGNDVLNGGTGTDFIYGEDDNDTLNGNEDNDTLDGGKGNDTFNGGTGNDNLSGGTGANTYMFSRGDGQDTINSFQGSTDTLSFSSGILTSDVTLFRRENDLEIRVNGSTDKITIRNHFTSSPITYVQFSDGTIWTQYHFDSLLDTTTSTSDDLIYGRNLSDNISGLSGQDVIYGYGGTDTINGGDGADILYGGEGDDYVNGDDGQDVLYGEAGNDNLNGGGGNDALYGGDGNDTYFYNLGGGVGTGVDTIYEVAETSTSFDVVRFGDGITESNTTYSKDGNDLVFRFNDYDYLKISNFFLSTDDKYKVEQFIFKNGTTWTSSVIQSLLTTPTNLSDYISGYDTADNINGLEGSDSLMGNGGDDVLLGAEGSDYLDGGTGNDTLDGGVGDDNIVGGIGNDTLVGGEGNDTLSGGAGDDVYQYQQGDGVDTISDASGNDTLVFGAGILPTEISFLRDGSALYLIRSTAGGIAMNLTVDQIETIQFQDGTVWNLATIQSKTTFGTVDTFTGTSANNSYTVDNNADVINEGVNQGIDSVTSSVSYTLGANIENLTLTGLLNLTGRGNALDNVLTGNSGNNFLDGGGYLLGYNSNDGADVLSGGAGDDTYFATLGDTVNELAGNGIDTIYTTATGYVLPDNVENLIIVGNYQYLMQVTGNSLNNTIIARDNWFEQVIDGGAGADIMSGGFDTTFYVDNVGDIVNGRGNYKVYSSVDFTLASQSVYLNNIQETLVLTGSDAITGTGNGGRNILDGRQNDAANILIGGAGDDTYIVGANDIVVELEGGGSDTLAVYAEYGQLYKASANVENITIISTNTNPVDLEGSEDNNVLQGNDGANHIRGLGGDDTITGGANWGDTLDGGDGNDSIYGNGWLYGGAGDDYLSSIQSSYLSGGAGNDTLTGRGIDSYLYARGDGLDTILDYTAYDPATAVNPASNYADSIIFGDGIAETDIRLARSGDDLLVRIAGTNDGITIQQHFAPADGVLSYAIEGFTFQDGTAWDTTIINAYLANYGSNQTSNSSDFIFGTSLNDRINGLQGDDYISAGDGDDQIDGGSGNDILVGKAGSDTLTGGAGDDLLQGGIGGDVYKFGRDDGHDVIIDAKHNLEIDTILLNNDIDPTQVTLKFDELVPQDLIISINGSSAQLTIKNFNAQENSKQIVFANGIVWDAFQMADWAISIIGTELADTLNGTESDDRLIGLGGNDTLYGLSGNDVLDGGLGADVMYGGADSDIYIVDNVGDIVNESSNAGYDSVESSITYTLTANVETLALTGSSNINGTGNALSNFLTGNDGNNQLDGGSGADIMSGRYGDDTYIVDNINDEVSENENQGIDTVRSSVTHTLYEYVENLTLTGSSAINGSGNVEDNILIGNSANNRLTGYEGNDLLDGGTGNDTMLGGLGDDTYVVNVTTDVVTELADEGIDTIQTSVSLSTLANNVENLVLLGTSALNGTGNGLNNVITGNSAVNTLTGGAGNDTLNGAGGNDILVGGLGNDVYQYYAGQGNDQIDNTATDNATAIDILHLKDINASSVTLSRVSSDLVVTVNSSATITIKNYYATGDNKIDQIVFSDGTSWNQADIQSRVPAIPTTGDDVLVGTSGNDTIDALAGNDTVSGGDGEDQLLGNTGNDALYGEAGNDILNGGAGNDTMVGGLGNDTYTVDSTSDVVTENLNEGVDIVNVAIATTNGSYTLAANVENGTLTNTVAYTLTGNALDNVLTGNSAANTLNGGDGNDTLNGLGGSDTMVGGLGDDTYTVDVTGDVVTEASGAGTDSVNVAISTSGGTYTLGANVENGTLTNTVAFTLTGNALNNILTGNAAANTLNGGDGNDILNGLGGNDTMVGGLGNDTYTIDATGDVVTEAASAGTDTVNVSIATASGTYTVAANVENAFLANTVTYNLTGNALANYLRGNAANNTFTDSAGGNDVHQGLAGNDSFSDIVGNNLLDGGIGTDTITAGSGRDIIIGGLDNDTITTGTGYDVILFNKGDGADTINASVGTDNTLSLGGNFAYSDLSLTKSSNDLILKMGASDQITLKGWYDTSANNKSVLNLQVIAEAMQGFSLGGLDTLSNNKVETFNFANLVSAFDAAGATANWQLTDARLTAHLSAGSDTAAIGGDIAYQYGTAGSLTGVGLLAAQAVINNASVGQSAQTLNASSSWASEAIKLT